MRILFPNLTRPKKAAKKLSGAFPQITLSAAQQAVAIVCGYRDWHDLDSCHAESEPTPLDQGLTVDAFRARALDLTVALSRELGINDGEIQYLLPDLRLTGDRIYSMDDHVFIRMACWRSGVMPWKDEKLPGATFLMKEKGRSPVPGYLRLLESNGVSYIDNTSLDCRCATFEAAFPRKRVDDFIPLRLWLPYGVWTLENGCEVLFSRDYKPLWKRHPDGSIERMRPSLWINGITQQNWFANASGKIWHSEQTKQLAEKCLHEWQVSGLPVLVDALPVLVDHASISIGGAAKHLDGIEQSKAA